ncbi:MAG: phage portal protein [Alistipes sp.]|nr:phage portal protein [Alistipes sp.]
MKKHLIRNLYLQGGDLSPFESPSPEVPESHRYWKWGSDNLFPEALALLSRRSATHRRIINDKADYISGKGFSFDPQQVPLQHLVEHTNHRGESLRVILNKLAFDKALFGNAFLEVILEPNGALSLYHQDASRCRIAYDNRHVLLHQNWRSYAPSEIRRLALYPSFEPSEDGTQRAVIHYKDYEPMYEHYGVPTYIAGLDVSAIAYKTDRWNISRLDNSFQLSGIMVLDGEVDNEQEAHQIITNAEKRFAGRPGQVMFMVKNNAEGDNSRFVPIESDNEGDWKALHDQATSDIVIAHSWFRSLSGLDYSSGFNAERILHEYEIALNTLILAEQQELLEPIRALVSQHLHCETDSLQVINRPPTRSKPLYMKVWEARKNDGLDYDPQDPEQQLYLAQITKYSLKSIE